MDVFVATRSASPLDDRAALRVRRDVAGTLRAAGLGLEGVFIADRGRRLLWHCRAAHAASATLAFHSRDAVPDRLWCGTARWLRGTRPTAVVEHAARCAAAGPAALSDQVRCLCLTTHRVEPAGELMTANGRIVLSFYRAPDTESVRLAQHHAGVPPGRVWALRPIS